MTAAGAIVSLSISFQYNYDGDNAVLKVWLGFGTKNTWLRVGKGSCFEIKDHVFSPHNGEWPSPSPIDQKIQNPHWNSKNGWITTNDYNASLPTRTSPLYHKTYNIVIAIIFYQLHRHNPKLPQQYYIVVYSIYIIQKVVGGINHSIISESLAPRIRL